MTVSTLSFTPDMALDRDRMAAVLRALGAGEVVDFRLLEDDLHPWFRLAPYRGVVHVLDGAGRHAGTFADVEAAVDRGWRSGCTA